MGKPTPRMGLSAAVRNPLLVHPLTALVNKHLPVGALKVKREMQLGPCTPGARGGGGGRKWTSGLWKRRPEERARLLGARGRPQAPGPRAWSLPEAGVSGIPGSRDSMCEGTAMRKHGRTRQSLKRWGLNHGQGTSRELT